MRGNGTEASLRHPVPARTGLLDAPVERAIAHGRLLLCTLSFLFFLLASGSTRPSDVIGPVILLAYTLHSTALAVLVRRWHPGSRGQLGIHVVDVMMTVIVLVLFDPSPSPAIAFCTFVLLAATLRWNWYGVIGTAAILALTLGAGASIPNFTQPFIAMPVYHGLYLGLAGAMLAYVAAYLEHHRRDLALLANWPAPDLPVQQVPVLTKALTHAAGIIGAPRIIVAWEEQEEPNLNIALLSNDQYQHRHEPSHVSRDFVETTLAPTVFAAENAASNIILCADGSYRLRAPIIDKDFKDRFDITSFATAPLLGKVCRGRLFLLDRDSWNTNHLTLIEIVASRLTTEIERQLVQIHAEQSAAINERNRLYRDLHDGLLQSLAALGFHVKALAASPTRQFGARIDTIKSLLANEQERIRSLIDATKATLNKDLMLHDSSHELLSEAARRWCCSSSIKIIPPDATIPKRLIEHLSFIFDEAIANAVRHGSASRVDVEIQKANGALVIRLRDDGHGFTMPSTSPAPIVMPASLCDRVGELGGSLSVHNSKRGAELTIELDLP